jgi:hypothetical protein
VPPEPPTRTSPASSARDETIDDQEELDDYEPWRTGHQRLPTDWTEDQADLIERLPDDLDAREMADPIAHEIVAEEGQNAGLDPDLAVFVSREELDGEEGP